MTIAEAPNQAVPGDEFLDELEQIRKDYLQGRLLRESRAGRTKDQIVEAKRRSHLGGDGNHRFEGERYLNTKDTATRRFQLRKLVDEGGQTSVGGPVPSHPTLARWESYEFGLTEEDVRELEKEDMAAQNLILSGWWYHLQRTEPWPVAIGSSLIGEGEKRIPEIRQRLLEQIEQQRKEYAAMGIKDVERALASAIEHSGVDVEHSEFGASVVRQFVDTPEMQDEMRRVFTIALKSRGSRVEY